MTSTLRALGLSLLLSAAAAASGCGGLTGDYCDAKCECEGCNDNQRDECSVQQDSRSDQAGVYDCGDYFDEYMECVVDHPFCDVADFRDPPACAAQKDRLDNCQRDRGIRIDLRAP